MKTFELELDCAEYYSSLMCGLRIFAGPPIYQLPSNVISATVGLVYINVQLEFELFRSSRFGQFRMFEKNCTWGHCPPQQTLKKKFCAGS